jgi:hydroxyacylglutathione hydrolase
MISSAMHAVTDPAPPFRTASGKLEVVQVPAASDNLVWLVVSPEGQAAAVDGPDAEGALDYCRRSSLRLTTIVNTHTHGDHVGINRDLGRRGMLDGLRVIGPARAKDHVPGITEPVDDGDVVGLFGVEWRVMLTEGHIDGHVCFVGDGVLFSGDTLFTGGCGYLFDGPPQKMHRSLTRLGELDGANKVCCAHEYTQDNLRFAFSVEPANTALAERIRRVWAIRAKGGSAVPSTIAEELATNPFMRHASPELQTSVRKAFPDRSLETPVEIFAATRALKDTRDYRSRPDAVLPL